MKLLRSIWGHWVEVCGLVCAGMLLSGCQTTQPPHAWPESSTNSVTAGRLRAGELLSVTYSDLANPVLPFEGRIKEDGTITLILNQTFTAAGKTVAELEKEIRERYVPSLFRNLTTTVRVLDRYFFVDGQVRQPNRYEHRGDLTVLGAIAAAGGFTDFAKRTKVQITRADKQTLIIDCKKATADPKLDLPIYPGDRVFVPKRWL